MGEGPTESLGYTTQKVCARARFLKGFNQSGNDVDLRSRDLFKAALSPQSSHDRHRGWLSHSRGKALLYDGAATRLREGRCLIRDPATYYQLCSIEGGTLRAPSGEADDRSDAFALAIAAIDQTPRGRFEGYV